MSLWTSGIVSDKSKLVVNECVPQLMGNMTEEKRKRTCVLNEHDYIRMSILEMTGSRNKTGAYCIVYNMYILTLPLSPWNHPKHMSKFLMTWHMETFSEHVGYVLI